MKHWIIEHAGGGLHCAKTIGDDLAAEGVNGGLRHAETLREGAPDEAWNWTTGEWEPRIAAIEAMLLAGIDRERVRRGGEVVTQGQSVLLGYTRKAAELAAYRALTTEEAASLNDPARRTRFPWLMADADLSGGGITAAADRIEAAQSVSEFRLRTIEARAVAGKAAVRAADTVEAKRAAAQIDWGDEA